MIAILADTVLQGGIFVDETLEVETFSGCTRGTLKDGQSFCIITHSNQLDGLILTDFYVAWPEYYWNANALVQKALSRMHYPKRKEPEPVIEEAIISSTGPNGPNNQWGCALLIGIAAFAAWDGWMLWHIWITK